MFKPLLITASAGSGKTYQLTNRYIAILLAGERPSRILATTFTRKAAGEIRERIFTRLAEAVLDRSKLEELRQSLRDSPVTVTRETVADALKRLLHENHRLNIGTLDSFFYSVAQSFSFELGQLPGWELAEAATLAEIERGALHTFCSSIETADLAELLTHVHRGELRRKVHEELESRVARLYDLFRETQAAAWDWLIAPPLCASEDLTSAIEALKILEVPQTKKGEPKKHWKDAVTRIQSAVNENRWRDFLGETLIGAVLSSEEKYASSAISEEWHLAIAPFIRQAAAILLRELRNQTKATWEILRQFSVEFERLKAQAAAKSFSDVSFLLSRAAIGERLEEIYFHLDCRLKHILFDEFQDTSRREWNVLKPVVAEVLSQETGEHSFFCVGDPKQAIYQWRGGVAEIFNSLQTTWRHIQVEPLTESRRSAQSIIAFVNQVFTDITENPVLVNEQQAARDWRERFSKHQTVKEEQGYVRVELFERRDKEEPFATSAIFKAMVTQVEALLKSNPDIEIGILVSRNELVAEIIEGLHAHTPPIPASEEGGNPLTDSASVNVVLSVLKLIDHPGCGISQFHVCSSPLGHYLGMSQHGNLAEAERVSKKLLQQFEVNGLAALVQDLCAVLMKHAASRDRVRLQQLVRLALRTPSHRLRLVSDFIAIVESTKVEDPSSSSVRVMTIHKSKGLEFDAVLLPELGEAMVKLDREPVFVFHNRMEDAPVRVIAYASENIRLLSEPLQDMFNQMRREKVKEALSALYVALTRARHALYIFSEYPPRYRLSASSVVLGALDALEDAAPGVIYERGQLDRISQYEENTSETAGPSSENPVLNLSIGKKRRGWIRQRPSDVDGKRDSSIDEILRLGQGDAEKRGRIIHRLMELVTWIEDGLPEPELVKEALRVMHCDVSREKEFMDLFYGVFEKKELQTVFSRDYLKHQGEIQLQREHPFALLMKGAVLRGAFDRLVLFKQDGVVRNAHIIDFKTGLGGAQDVQSIIKERMELYEVQMRAYRSAVCSMYRLAPQDVHAQVVFLEAHRVLEV